MSKNSKATHSAKCCAALIISICVTKSLTHPDPYVKLNLEKYVAKSAKAGGAKLKGLRANAYDSQLQHEVTFDGLP